MKRILILNVLIFALFAAKAQNKDPYNLSLENYKQSKELPQSWTAWGTGYPIQRDSLIKHSGQSSVCIKAKPNPGENDFGGIGMQIPLHAKAKKITLTGWMKFEQVSGQVGLVLNVMSNASESMEFDNMSSRKITGSSDWKKYTVTLPYHASASGISIGCITTGTGTLWVDDFEVLLDGKPIQDIKSIVPEYAASKDHAFDEGSLIQLTKPSNNQLSNLERTALVWGFLKYYHPKIAQGQYQWDYELFRKLPSILQAPDQAVCEQILLTWVQQLGENKAQAIQKPKEQEVAIPADYQWIQTQLNSVELKSALSALILSSKPKTHYYISFVPGVGNPIFTNESENENMLYPDDGYRLLALFRYWNMIQYYFPYRDLIGAEWTQCLHDMLPKFIAASNQLEYQLACKEMICRIHDSHAGMMATDNAIQKSIGDYIPCLKVRIIDDQCVVTKVMDTLLNQYSAPLLPGDVVVSINHQPLAEIRKERLPYTPGSNLATQLRNLSNSILLSKDSLVQLDILRDKQKLEIQVPALSKTAVSALMDQPEHHNLLTILPNDIAYVNLNDMGLDSIDHVMKQAIQAKAIIFDIRNYPNSFCLFLIGNYLMPKSIDMVTWSSANPQQPGLFEFKSTTAIGYRNSKYFKGKVMILVNEETQSMAEYTSMALRVAPNAKVIGSTTAGADGNVSEIHLPGGLSSYISGIGVYYPDHRGTQRVGIVPDIEVHPTVASIREGRDLLIERAVEEIQKD